jgi:hypothetical protein
MKVIAIATFAVLSALGCASDAHANWLVGADAGLIFDSNVSHAQLDHDVKQDLTVYAGASLTQYIQLTDRTGLAITGLAKSETYLEYAGLSNVSYGLSLASRTKLGLGAEAPWVRVSADVQRLDYHVDVRTGWLAGVGAAIGKRFGERWNATGAYRFEHRTTDTATGLVPGIPGDVFDLEGRTLSAALEYSVTPQTILLAGYSRRSGDVASTTQRNFPIFKASSAIDFDPVFGNNTFGYKLYGISHTLDLGVSHALGDHTSVNVGWQRNWTYGTNDVNYFGNVVRASLLLAF